MRQIYSEFDNFQGLHYVQNNIEGRKMIHRKYKFFILLNLLIANNFIMGMEKKENRNRCRSVMRKRLEISLCEAHMSGKIILSEDKQNIQFFDFWDDELSYIKPIKKVDGWPIFSFKEQRHLGNISGLLKDMFWLLPPKKKETEALPYELDRAMIEKVYELQIRRSIIFLMIFDGKQKRKLIEEIARYRLANKEFYAFTEIDTYLKELNYMQFEIQVDLKKDTHQACSERLAEFGKIPLRPLKDVVSELYPVNMD